MGTRRILGVVLGIGGVIAMIGMLALLAGWLGCPLPVHVVAASIGGAVGTGIAMVLIPVILPRVGIRPMRADTSPMKSRD